MTRPTTTRLHTVLSVLGTLLLFQGLLLLPEQPTDFQIGHFLHLPLELPAVLLAMLLLRDRAFRWLRLVVLALTGVLVLLALGDLGSRLAFGRAFSPLAEWHLLGKGWSLAADTIGRTEASLLASLATALLLCLLGLLYLGFGRIRDLHGHSHLWLTRISILVLLGGTLAWALQNATGRSLGASPITVTALADRVDRAHRSIADQLAFQQELDDDPLAGSTPDFSALQGMDIVVLFVESYDGPDPPDPPGQ